MRPVVLLLAMVVGTLNTAIAAEMRSVQVDYEDGRYTMMSEVWFDAPVEHVFEVFRRWDLSTQFSSVIVESRDEAADELGRPQYYVRNQGCLLFFCRSFERRGHVELEVNEVLRAIANPEISDFLQSDETWKFSGESGGTVVYYLLHM